MCALKGTYALKAGPQTLLSQWVVSLDEDVSEDDSESKWEDVQQTFEQPIRTTTTTVNPS